VLTVPLCLDIVDGVDDAIPQVVQRRPQRTMRMEMSQKIAFQHFPANKCESSCELRVQSCESHLVNL